MLILDLPDAAAVHAAAVRIAGHVVTTPLVRSDFIDSLCGARVYFKCENLQAIGAFKARGAANAVLSLTPEAAAHGVVTHSSGNHAAALARAARRAGIAATIVMPTNAPATKRALVLREGGQVVDCEPTLAAREAGAAAVMAATGATLVHPYDDAAVIAGQGTAVLEVYATGLKPALLLVPVGGGGLLAGSGLATRSASPGTRVIGVEPTGADDAARSFRTGIRQPQTDPHTMADGLRTALGERPFALLRQVVDDIVTVSEDGIRKAMDLLFNELKLVVEPSGAVAFAALLEGRVVAHGQEVLVVLSGGNVDLSPCPWCPAKDKIPAQPSHAQ
jgi:threonine dehydratase